MLPKSKRLSTKAFKEIIEKGQSFHGPFLILRAINNVATSGFGVSVPKKVAKSAVLRNKMRRRVYTVIKSLKIKKGFSGVVILKIGAPNLTFGVLKSDIEKVFVKSLILE